MRGARARARVKKGTRACASCARVVSTGRGPLAESRRKGCTTMIASTWSHAHQRTSSHAHGHALPARSSPHVMHARHVAPWRRFPSVAGEELDKRFECDLNQAPSPIEWLGARRMRDVSEFESCAVRSARAARAHMHDRV